MKNLLKHFVIIALAAVMGFTMAGCGDPGGGLTGGTFTAVSNITGIPSYKLVDSDLTLAGTVVPSGATNKNIIWAIADDDDDSAAPTLTGNVLKTETNGTVKITATIVNGKTENTNFTKNFTITVVDELDVIPVSGITDVPTAAAMGVDLPLTGTVEPEDATNKTIVWSISAANVLAGATVADGKLKTTTEGIATVTATITDGLAEGEDYTEDFAIAVTDPASFTPVTNITGIPAMVTVNTDFTLTGTVVPAYANNTTIVWSKAVDNANSGVTVTNGVFKATSTGLAKVTATIINGASATTDYTQTFTINVIPAPYSINIGTFANGSVSATVNGSPATGANAGAVVTLTATANDGYLLTPGSLKVNNGAVSLTDNGNNYTFTMPASSVTVSAEFETAVMIGGKDLYVRAKGNVAESAVVYFYANSDYTVELGRMTDYYQGNPNMVGNYGDRPSLLRVWEAALISTAPATVYVRVTSFDANGVSRTKDLGAITTSEDMTFSASRIYYAWNLDGNGSIGIATDAIETAATKTISGTVSKYNNGGVYAGPNNVFFFTSYDDLVLNRGYRAGNYTTGGYGSVHNFSVPYASSTQNYSYSITVFMEDEFFYLMTLTADGNNYYRYYLGYYANNGEATQTISFSIPQAALLINGPSLWGNNIPATNPNGAAPKSGGDRVLKITVDNLSIGGKPLENARIATFSDAAFTVPLETEGIFSINENEWNGTIKGTPSSNRVYVVVLASVLLDSDETWAAKTFTLDLGTYTDPNAPKEVRVDFGAVSLKTVSAGYSFLINGLSPYVGTGFPLSVGFFFEVPGIYYPDSEELRSFDLGGLSTAYGGTMEVPDLSSLPFPVQYSAFGYDNNPVPANGQRQQLLKIFTSGGPTYSSYDWSVTVDDIAKKITGTINPTDFGLAAGIAEARIRIYTGDGTMITSDDIYAGGAAYNRFGANGFKMLVPSADTERTLYLTIGDAFSKPFTVSAGNAVQNVVLEWDEGRTE